MPPKDSRFAGLRARVKEAAKASVSRAAGYITLPSGWDYFKPKPGLYLFDILPYIVGDVKQIENKALPGQPWWRRRYRVHMNVGVDKTSVVCPTTIGERCPICEFHRAHREAGDMDDAVLSGFRYKVKDLFLLKSKDRDTMDKQYIMDISKFSFSDQLDEDLNSVEDGGEDDYMLDFFLPDGGSTLKIRFKEETFDRFKFAKVSRIDFLSRKYKYKDSIVDEMPCLDDVLVIHDYKTLDAMFMEMDPEDDEDGDGDAAPRRSGRGRREEEQEDEAPRRSGRGRRPEPEDGGNGGDDEGEEAPRGRGRRKAEPEDDPQEEAPRGRGRRRAEPEADPEDNPEDGDSGDGEDGDAQEAPKSGHGGVRRRSAAKDPEPEEKPKNGRRGAKADPEDSGDGECPFGHVFGKDTDEFTDDCTECEKWEDCQTAKEKATSPRRRR